MSNYLSRNKIYGKAEPTKDAKIIYIFCEGEETEVAYFNYFRDLHQALHVFPIANIDGKSNPFRIKEHAEFLFFDEHPTYKLDEANKDEVWFVIDTDNWNEGGKIDILKTYCEGNNNEIPMWFVAQSNPCFEIWQYYHEHEIKPIQEQIEICKSFKEYVSGKIKGGFDPRKNPIKIQNAIINAEKHFALNELNQPDLFSTEVFKLAKVILPFVKEQIDKQLIK